MAYIRSMFSLDNLKDEIFRLLGLDTLIRSVSGYIESRVDLIKMEIREEITRHLSRLIVTLTGLLLALSALGFLSITLALVLNEALESPYLGFLIVGGSYLLVSLLIFAFRDSISRSVQKGMKQRMNPKP